MAFKKKGLGRGLEALLADNDTFVSAINEANKKETLKIYEIEPNRNQPRKNFDVTALEDLASSIATHGIIQPIIVRKKVNGFYEIVAGERRWRAAKMAGLVEVPVIIRELTDQDTALLAVVENLQREDLNPVEEARGYRSLIENFGLTQEEAAAKVSKSRANVTNMLRLLKLPDSVLTFVEQGKLSYGHARALIPLGTILNESELIKQATYIVDKQLSVRDTEQLVKNLSTPKITIPPSKVKQSYFVELERKASERFGRRIKLTEKALTIPYTNSEDLERILTSICGKEFFEDIAID